MPPFASILEVAENDSIVIKARFTGNPKPTVSLKWTHESRPISLLAVQLYPNIHQASHQLAAPLSYCGRVFTTTLTNMAGVAYGKNITIAVLRKLFQEFMLGIFAIYYCRIKIVHALTSLPVWWCTEI